jgi:hypothetical protein
LFFIEKNSLNFEQHIRSSREKNPRIKGKMRENYLKERKSRKNRLGKIQKERELHT